MILLELIKASTQPPPGYPHSYTFFYLHRDVRTACCWVAAASLLANFLPRQSAFDRWPRVKITYGYLIDVVAFMALNFRACLPSLQQEFLGFRLNLGRRGPERSAK